MGHLLPGDSSMLAARALCTGVWSITPICWLILFQTLFLRNTDVILLFAPTFLQPLLLKYHSFALSLPFLFQPYQPRKRPFLTAWSLIYCCIEALFSLYHLYLTHRVQAPGPRPLYGRRFLREVLTRALESGMRGNDAERLANGSKSLNGRGTDVGIPGALSSVEVSGTDHGRTQGQERYNLRARAGRKSGAAYADEEEKERPTGLEAPKGNSNGNGNANGNANGHASHPPTTSARKHVNRLRSGSFVPSFVERPLDKDDPRAIRFQEMQAKWYMGAPADQTTRRDAETWLAWALFGADLEMIEAEHEAAVARRERRAQLGDDANLSPETSAPPSPMPPAQARFGDTSPSPSPSSAGHDQRDMSKINVHPGAEDWDPDDPVKGDRLLFVHYCRELIEARQGFAYPTRSSAWAPDAHPDPRRAPTNKMMRLTIDPVRVRSRPLASYLLTNALSRLTIRHATWKGFSREREGKLEYLILRPREWTREKAEKDEKYMPIVFLHGLGIGLAQYASLVSFFLTSPLSQTHPILILLQPAISQDIFSPQFLQPLGHHETTSLMRQVLIKEGWEQSGITVLSHSMGTIIHAWLLKSLGKLVRRSCFVDPVCFCLWVPWVCHNFVYKRATTPIEVLMRYFVGRELGTANMLCRHFDWSSNILWPQDEIPNLLDPHHTRFFLAGMDSILNAKETREYLREHGVRDTNEGASKEAPEGVERGGMIVGWEQAHGEMLMHDGKGIAEIVRWLEEPSTKGR